MQLVVLLLLVAGLAFLVLGLITGSTPLVLASIAASLLAVGAIVRHRRRQEDGAAGTPRAEAARAAGSRAGTARDDSLVPVLAPTTGEGRARESAAVPVEPKHLAGFDGPAGSEELAGPVSPGEPPVGPGEPKHLAGAEVMAAPASPATPESPAESNVSADPEPADPEPAEADTDPPLRSRGDEPVWVIDGRPRYHLSGCASLIGRESEPEPVPLRQAVEDGFTPCALCDPDSGLAAR